MADFENFFAEQSSQRNTVYTRLFQLPVNVAFRIIEWEQPDSKFSKQKTNRVLLALDEFVSLQVYPGVKFDNFDENKMNQLNAAIREGHSWYVVARHWTSKDRVPVDVVSEATREKQNLPVFDCDVHTITKFENDSNKYGKSDDGPSPKKRR